jgi:hypothetical protein
MTAYQTPMALAAARYTISFCRLGGTGANGGILG